MVKIRLTKVGSKKNAHYRLIAVPARTKRETKALEILGFYNPTTKEVNFKKDRIDYWRSKGAQPTDTVLRLLGEKVERDYSKDKRVLEKKAREAKEEKAKKETEAEKEATPEVKENNEESSQEETKEA